MPHFTNKPPHTPSATGAWHWAGAVLAACCAAGPCGRKPLAVPPEIVRPRISAIMLSAIPHYRPCLSTLGLPQPIVEPQRHVASQRKWKIIVIRVAEVYIQQQVGGQREARAHLQATAKAKV